jgi:hypothetical protein
MSVHRMGDYVEMHAVPLSEPARLVPVRDGEHRATGELEVEAVVHPAAGAAADLCNPC